MKLARRTIEWLMRPHPDELERGVWFQEEARAERAANLLRMVYMLTWTPLVIMISGDHPFWANVSNIGGGAVYLTVIVAYHFYLRFKPYKPIYKYLSTAVDVFINTGILFLYNIDMGYSTVLKAPPFMNYLAILMLAAFRFNSVLPIYVSGLAAVAYSGLFVYMLTAQDVQFGTPLEMFTTPRINLVYQLLRLSYLAIFALVGYLLTRNVHRLVRLRVDEEQKALEEQAQRRRTQELLERYFTPEIASYLTEHPQDMGGSLQRVTVIVTDLRGFTSLSEKLGPTASVALLNKLFEGLVSIVFEHQGTLDKFFGDGMLVVFGVPSHRPDDALQATKAAWAMVEQVSQIEIDGHALDIGVAIHTGEVIFGNVGSPQRMELTVIGDPVNTASRMEALNKEFGTHIIMSETTYHEVRDWVQVRELPATRLRGKTKEMKLYAVEAVSRP